MFYSGSGALLHANCAVSPNADVSGIGVRLAFYLQALIMITLSKLNNKPHEVFLSNLSIQIPALALISSAYFDTAIDVPHTVIASQFSILFSACRMSVYDLSVEYLSSRRSLKVTSRIAVVDVVFRWFLVLFNFTVWSSIIQLQRTPEVCPDGFGQWFFFSPVELNVASSAITFVYVYTILEIVWESLRIIMGFFRGLELDSTVAEERLQWNIDPRQWIVANTLYSCLSKDPSSTLSRNQFMKKVCKFLRHISLLRRISFLIFFIVAIEKTIALNTLVPNENTWAFGQIFAMANTFFLLSQSILIITRNLHVKLQDGWLILGFLLGAGLFVFVGWKGTQYSWQQHEAVWPGVFDNMKWYQYPIEMFCYGGSLFVGFMVATVVTAVAYAAVMAVVSLGAVCLLALTWWVPSEIRDAVFRRFDRVTQSLQYAIGIGDTDDTEEGNVAD